MFIVRETLREVDWKYASYLSYLDEVESIVKKKKIVYGSLDKWNAVYA
jgi:hypothetical protein